MQEAGLAAHSVKRALTAFLSNNVEPGCRVIVAVSGGADSLALAAAVAQLPTGTVFPTVVIVDHQLQPGSADVAAQAAADCAALGLADARIRTVEVPASGSGVEAAARNARYAALQAAAAELAAAGILLAHTRDDQAETVLLRLARGSGSRSLSAMQPVAQVAEGVPLWRPLLELPRAVVRASLADFGLVAHEDPQNTDPRFRRSRVRNELLPVLIDVLGTGAVEGLARTAELARQDADALDALAGSLLAQSQTAVGELDLAALAGQPTALIGRALRSWLVAAGVPADALGFDQMRELVRLATEPAMRGPIRLVGGVEVEKQSGRLRAARRNDGRS